MLAGACCPKNALKWVRRAHPVFAHQWTCFFRKMDCNRFRFCFFCRFLDGKIVRACSVLDFMVMPQASWVKPGLRFNSHLRAPLFPFWSRHHLDEQLMVTGCRSSGTVMAEFIQPTVYNNFK